MDNFVNSIKAVLYERTTSPLFGAFGLSWLAWNYKVIVVLTSNLPVLEKLTFVENELYPTWYIGLPYLFLLPAATALLYLFAFPYPSRYVHKFWRKRQQELRSDRLEIEGATLLSLDESRQIRQSIIDIQTEYDRVQSHSNSELKRVKEALDDRHNEIERLQKEIVSLQTGKANDEAPEVVADEVLDSILRSRPYRLYHNPEVGRERSKIMMFGPGGKIIEGSNNNESSWRVLKGKLELLQSDGKIHTRFSYQPNGMLFIDTNDSEVASSVKGKFMVPEPDAAKS